MQLRRRDTTDHSIFTDVDETPPQCWHQVSVTECWTQRCAPEEITIRSLRVDFCSVFNWEVGARFYWLELVLYAWIKYIRWHDCFEERRHNQKRQGRKWRERKERATSPSQILKNHQHSTQKRHIWLRRLQRRSKETTQVSLDTIFFKEYISSESIEKKAHHDTEH